MTVLRCTAKLLKRMRLPGKLPEPAPQANPLGEWYADIDFWHRQPFVVMLNAATGVVLVLPGNAEGLRRLHERALLQFAALCEHFRLGGPGVDAELHGFDARFTCANTRDRSLLASINQRKEALWTGFEYSDAALIDGAAREWLGLFKHPALGRETKYNTDYHRPLDLAARRLMTAAGFIPSNDTRH